MTIKAIWLSIKADKHPLGWDPSSLMPLRIEDIGVSGALHWVKARRIHAYLGVPPLTQPTFLADKSKQRSSSGSGARPFAFVRM